MPTTNPLARTLSIFGPAGTMRARILLCLVLAVVPLTALSLYLAVDERREEDARARLEEQSIVGVVRTDLDRLFQLSRNLVASMSREKTDAEMCGYLGLLRQSFPEFFNIGIFDLHSDGVGGTFVCGAIRPAKNSFYLSPEEARLVAGIHRQGEIVVTPIRGNVVDGRPVIPVAGLARVLPDGTRRLVVASIDLAWLSRQVNQVPIPSKAVLLILDRHGVIAAREPPSTSYAPGKPAPDFERGLPSRGDFDGEVIGEYGISRFYTLARVGAADGLVVVLKIRSAEVYRRSRQRLTAHLIGLFAVAALVFGATWISTDRYVARPLARLTSVAGQLASGNLSERSGLEYQGEIGRLAHSFDLMAASVQREETHSAEMLQALRALTAQIECAREEERTRIAREIHDELGQQLTAMRFDLIDMKTRLRERPTQSSQLDAALCERAAELTGLVDPTIGSVRRIATELRPRILDTFGPIAAIEWLASDFEKRTHIRCIYEGPAELKTGPGLATTLFRICQESLTNAARHSQATEVRIRLTADDDWITLEVRDDGCGLAGGTLQPSNSLGVMGMRERARMAGGDLEICGEPGMGTTVSARIPAAAERSRS
jgi:signal transduction histidine kinase